jgi:hypothetical protein
MLLQQAQTDGLLDPIADPQPVAEILVRLVLSFILTPGGAVKLQTTAELESFARAHLAPLVTRVGEPS